MNEAPHKGAAAAAPRTSSWALASLLCSTAVCCPAMSIIGPLLGARALVEIKAHPNVSGRRLAWSGIAIGVVSLLLWAAALVWWHFNARVPMMSGPVEALRRGLDGDIAAFREAFEDDKNRLSSDAEAEAFLSQLGQRYGRLIDSAQRTDTPPPPSGIRESALRIGYVMQFERGQVNAEAAFVTFAKSRLIPKPAFKWRFVRIIDPERGDLVYPASTSIEAAGGPAG